jgi:C-terminal processing protease CtpA/Prc
VRKILVLIGAALLTACGGSGDGGISSPPPSGGCSVTEQKQFVLDAMRSWYLWNNLLPASVDINAYATPIELLNALTAVQPLDQFSGIQTLEADTQFFGEGKYEGFGFSSRFLSADDLRLTRVFVDSPANAAGLARGQQILELNGRTIAEIEAAEGVGAVFDTAPIDFLVRETSGTEFTVNIDVGIVTIDPIPQFRIIPVPGTPGVGYIELAQFISTAEPDFQTVFSQFSAAGVTDLIIDMRFNGGGLVTTTEILADYLGGFVAQNLVFSKTTFNDDRATNNSQSFFGLRSNSLGLSRMIVIASQNTASASEMIANGMEPHVEVAIVGDRTFGKPVGQVGLNFCDQVLRPTAFSLTNADDFGDYFGGLPADCPVTDDLSIPVGDDNDPNVAAALTYFSTGACPVAAAPAPSKPAYKPARKSGPEAMPHRELADAY